MKKLFLILLFFPLIGFGQVDCSLLGVADLNIDTSNMSIDIAIYNGDINHLNYPYVAYTINNIGDTIQNGNINLFGAPSLDTTWYSYSLINQGNLFYPLSICFINSGDTCILSYHPSCDSVITTFNYIDSSSIPYLIDFNIETFDLSNGNFGYGGFVLLNNQGDTIGYENINTAGNVFGLMQYNIENRVLELIQTVNLPFSGSLHLINGWFAGNPATSCVFPFNINGSITAVQEICKSRKILNIVDLLGRDIKETNQLFFYIYDDGTVEKIIKIK